MTQRHIAILIDGGFFLKRLPHLVTPARCDTPGHITACIRHMCHNHVKALTGCESQDWNRHVYRIFYYDAVPYDGKAHHPISNHSIDFVALGLRQKGVDMRIGVDIASLVLKKQVDTLILVAGDSDFVPAAKLARREGIDFILDPLWQRINSDLFEHIDGLQSGLSRPGQPQTPGNRARRTAMADQQQELPHGT